jgi:hypothetical protein
MLVCLSCSFLKAQNTTPSSNDIFDQVASESANTKKPEVLRWSLSDPRCTIIYTNGSPVERVSDNGHDINVMAPRVRDKHSYTVLVGVENWRQGALDVDPANMGGLTDESPQGVMLSIDGDKLLADENKSAHRRAIFGNALSGFAAGYGNNTTATVQNSDGTTTTATVHSSGNVSQAERDAANNRDAINSISASEASLMLRRNTVAQRGYVGGRVYVERPKRMSKKAHIGSFVIDLGDTIYIFPFVNGSVPTK